VSRRKRVVVYQVFGDSPGPYYIEDLRRLAAAMPDRNGVSFYVVATAFQPTTTYALLAARWDAGERDMGADVRDALLAGPLLEFAEPVAIPIYAAGLTCSNWMTTLLVGFDSAWTRTKIGAIVGAVSHDDGRITELGPPRPAQFEDAAGIIRGWQTAHSASSTLVLLDQPTIVVNDVGQRPVEHVVCPCISRRRGGMQPANRGRTHMFGPAAPVWEFLAGFGGAADPFDDAQSTRVWKLTPC
jgi:hypothetical protein